MHFYSIYDQCTTHCVKSSFQVQLFNFGETLPKCNEFSFGKYSQGYDPTFLFGQYDWKLKINENWL